ncbi:MDMPI N domain containing protein [Streptomyces griseorubiginosus]|uniref:MDMPI N domain containing protein n=1 Tax=Streptomyces griseorubiginosus TaxID=67304 RepID=UPI002E80FF8C|nr:MDMPI N domain containing protein [Streptomyces griseorubiginosus]WUB46249.1 MDMPI N domain containing protein [Streptomyces griseorubiginosus]WUB54770.1 MDMPI N domain containing protein [Streptomyces griseorubiginosus]
MSDRFEAYDEHGEGPEDGSGDAAEERSTSRGRPEEHEKHEDHELSGATGDGSGDGTDGGDGSCDRPDQPPRIPLPRASVEDTGRPLPELDELPRPAPLVLEHQVLKSLLGAWALAACSAEETAAVEDHLGDCGTCAEEALRLRGAVGLLQRPESLDLDPGLRTRVLDGCLDRRPPRIPIPKWATPYDAETARLDALLQDFGDAEWHAPVRLRWFDADEATSRRTTVAGVIAHLLSVDGLVAVALGLDDPMGEVPAAAPTPAGRTEAYWRASHFPPTRSVRTPWREQSHDLVRTVSFTGGTSGGLTVPYGDFELPLHDAMLDRAFECWVHAEDIAEAVDYPYEPPSPRHLNKMIDLGVRMLPAVLAERRRKGLASPGPGRHLVPAGDPGRTLRLEIEGHGGGEWLIPLDSPAAVGSAEHEVAHVALDGVEFCQLAAGHVPPAEAAAGQRGDREAIRDVLFAAASLSRM